MHVYALVWCVLPCSSHGPTRAHSWRGGAAQVGDLGAGLRMHACLCNLDSSGKRLSASALWLWRMLLLLHPPHQYTHAQCHTNRDALRSELKLVKEDLHRVTLELREREMKVRTRGCMATSCSRVAAPVGGSTSRAEPPPHMHLLCPLVVVEKLENGFALHASSLGNRGRLAVTMIRQ